MKKLLTPFLAILSICSTARAQIYADFKTSAGDFSVVLDHIEAPLAVANFIHLAGKGDDIFETRAGVPPLDSPLHKDHGYFTTAESDSQKLALTVTYVPSVDGSRAQYVIKQSQTYIGAVEAFQLAGYYPDITGQDRVRLSLVNPNPLKYRITMRYPRSWIDPRFQLVRNTPMYRGMPVTKVETGKRFFSGSFSNNPLEGPGYHFQDEILRDPGNTFAPYGTPFNTAWRIAMDSVGPNRNGSRFFITTAADRSWNGRYTAFGTVEQNAGRLVVQAIANGSADSNGVPLNQVVIQDITIRNVGNPPQSFFPGFHQGFLPGEIEPLDLRFETRDSKFSLITPLRPATQTSIYTSTDLINYLGGGIQPQSPSATEESVVDLSGVLSINPKFFVKGFAVSVPSWPSAQVNLEGAIFSFRVNSGNDTGTLRLNFDEDGINGTYSIDMEVEQTRVGLDPVLIVSKGSGKFQATYNADAGPYIGTFDFNLDLVTGPLNVERIRLHIDSTRFANNPQVDISQIIRRYDARNTDPRLPILSYSGIFQQLK